MQGCEQDGEAPRDLSQRESFHTKAWRGRGKKWCPQTLMRAEATEEQRLLTAVTEGLTPCHRHDARAGRERGRNT